MDKNKIEEIVNSYLPYKGYMIYPSKSGYRSKHPDNHIFFNGYILTEDDGEIWYGDIDLTESKSTLISLSNQLDKDLYVFSEFSVNGEHTSLADIVDSIYNHYYIVRKDKIVKVYYKQEEEI